MSEQQNNEIWRVFRDGKQWCAVGPGFENLQESHAGFGDEIQDAIDDLRSKGVVVPEELGAFEIDFDVERRRRECSRFDDCETGLGTCWCLSP